MLRYRLRPVAKVAYGDAKSSAGVDTYMLIAGRCNGD
jgi:hypothetical protein